MKNLKNTLFILTLLTVTVFSCGSSEKVIMKNGNVYEVKGKKIFSNGEDVTQTLTNQETKDVLQTLDQRLKVEGAAEEAKEKIEKEKEKAKKALEKAEKEKEEIEKKLKEKKEAREDFFKAKEELTSTKEKYKKLLDKGKLSPLDIEKWEKRVKSAEKEVINAESNLKRY